MAAPAPPPSSWICAVDVGTTAVKAVVLPWVAEHPPPAARVLAHAEAAYATTARGAASPAADVAEPDRGVWHEQDVGAIVAAVDECVSTALIAAAGGSARPPCDQVALAWTDQMHGVMCWNSVDVRSRSRLVTWQDGRCGRAMLAEMNDAGAMEPEPHGATPVHAGYGCATLVWWLRHGWLSEAAEDGDGGRPRWWFQDPGEPPCGGGPRAIAIVDRVGTVGTYLTNALAGGAGSTAAMDATDAASWGGWDMARGAWSPTLTRRWCPRLPALLATTHIAPAQAPIGAVTPHTCRAVGLSRTADWLWPPTPTLPHPITISTAHHGGEASGPCVTTHVCMGDHPASVAGAWTLLRDPPGVDDTTIIITMGTSAQAACVMRGPHTLRPVPHAVPSPAPVVLEHRPWPLSCDGGTHLLVAASMNGGNVSAALAEWMAEWVTCALAGGGAPMSVDAAFAVLEREGLAALHASSHPAPSHPCPPPPAAAPRSVAEEVWSRWMQATPRMTALPHGERCVWNAAALAQASPHSTAHLDTLTGMVSSHRQRVAGGASSLGVLYVTTMCTLLHNVCAALPRCAWACATHIQVGGGVFAKSAVARACLDMLIAAWARGQGTGDTPIMPIPPSMHPYLGALGAAHCLVRQAGSSGAAGRGCDGGGT